MGLQKNDFQNALLPLIMQQLLEVIIEKRSLNLRDALHYLYSSNLYNEFSLGSPSLEQLDPPKLYELLKKEKREQRKRENHSPDLLLFVAFCIENYKRHKNIDVEYILYIFNKYNLIDYLSKSYDTLHTQGKEYIMEEIERFIECRK